MRVVSKENRLELDLDGNKQISSEVKMGLIVGIIVALWVFLISDNPLKIVLAIVTGLTSGLVYYFVIAGCVHKCEVFAFPSQKMLTILFITLLFAFLVPPINNIYVKNWFSISIINWIRFIVVSIFCMFIPGFIVLRYVDKEGKLSTQACIVLSALLSFFFTSLFWYLMKILLVPSDWINILFISLHCVLVLVYFQFFKKSVKSKRVMPPRTFDSYETLTLGILVLFSVFLVFLQQFVYNPFIRGDNWSYLEVSNFIDKAVPPILEPIEKYYRVGPPFLYSFFALALFHLTGFPPINSMMITSIVVSSLIPISFYAMALQYTKNKNLSILSTFIYVAFSGFGWIPFILQKFSDGIKSYSAQELFMTLRSIAPKVLWDITEPQGLMPEGFKTYVLGTLAIIMLFYLLESGLPSKARGFLIATMVIFAFQVHVSEILVWVLIFMPAYVLLSDRKLVEIRKDIISVAMGFLLIFFINLTCPRNLMSDFTLQYIFVAAALCIILGFTFMKSHIKLKVSNHKLGLLRLIVPCLACYLYLLSMLVLVLHGYSNMYYSYSTSIGFLGFTFPWYYYPLSLGVVGLLMVIGLFIISFKEKSITLFLLITVCLLIFGRLISFLNVNFFFTREKEWRIIYRVVPISASLFVGWIFYKLMRALKKRTLRLQLRLVRFQSFQLHLHTFATLLFIVLIMLGIPSTLLASEYWMVSNATPIGPGFTTDKDIEAANYIWRNLPATLRVATSSSGSNALVKLTGSPVAIPEMYPDFLSASRPETAALLSSDIGYIYIDSERDSKYTKNGIVDYLLVIFDNSRVTIFELPYFEPPTTSNVGYIAPLSYNNKTILSYMFLASLNSSYQMVLGDDIYDKLVLFSPCDFPEYESNILDWVERGGTSIVFGFGESGTIFKSLGLKVSGESEADGVSVGGKVYSLGRKFTFRTLTTKDEAVEIVSYYILDEYKTSPFAFQRSFGKGKIIYIYIDPLVPLMRSQKDMQIKVNDVASIIRELLHYTNVSLPNKSNDFARFPLEKRWMGRYRVYGENNLVAEGDISISSSLCGSYLLQYPITAKKLTIDSTQLKETLENVLIDKINAIGKADLKISSNEFKLCKQTLSIPSYVPLQFEECTLEIRPSNNSILEIETDDKIFSINDGEVIFEFNSAFFLIKDPSFDVDGSMRFGKICLPSVANVIWSENVRLTGTVMFHINYNDENYFFCDEFEGAYKVETPGYPEIEDNIPWKEILISPLHVLLLLCLALVTLLRKFSYKDVQEDLPPTASWSGFGVN